MRKTRKLLKFALLIMLALLIKHANAQYEWAPIGAEWYYSINGEGMYVYEKYVSEKDTLIEGKQCRVVKSDLHTDYFYQDGYKVYYWYNNKFNLIYDFDAEVNDTITFGFKLGIGCTGVTDETLDIECIVKKIDTLIIDGNAIREFETDPITTDTLGLMIHSHWYVEKFGNVWNFFEALYGPRPAICTGGTTLRCYLDHNISYKTEYDSSYPCDSVLNIEDIKQYKLADVYPNPFNEVFFIEFIEQSNIENIEISIFDFLGREFQVSKANCTIEQIDMSTLKPGAYYLRITDLSQNESQIIKIIKQ